MNSIIEYMKPFCGDSENLLYILMSLLKHGLIGKYVSVSDIKPVLL